MYVFFVLWASLADSSKWIGLEYWVFYGKLWFCGLIVGFAENGSGEVFFLYLGC